MTMQNASVVAKATEMTTIAYSVMIFPRRLFSGITAGSGWGYKSGCGSSDGTLEEALEELVSWEACDEGELETRDGVAANLCWAPRVACGSDVVVVGETSSTSEDTAVARVVAWLENGLNFDCAVDAVGDDAFVAALVCGTVEIEDEVDNDNDIVLEGSLISMAEAGAEYDALGIVITETKEVAGVGAGSKSEDSERIGWCVGSDAVPSRLVAKETKLAAWELSAELELVSDASDAMPWRMGSATNVLCVGRSIVDGPESYVRAWTYGMECTDLKWA
jgi:hypothetical protein